MSTITQRKKGWWKIWIVIAIVVALLAVGVALYYFGYDYISWMGVSVVNEKMWASASWINSVLDIFLFIGIGVGITYLYYAYIRGNKVTGVQTAGAPGYAPVPSYPSQPQQNGQETVIS